MAEVQPLNALHYDVAAVGSLAAVTAPPYDVIDPLQRAALLDRSPFNVVAVDLPKNGAYDEAAETFARWRAEGVVVRDPEPAIWALRQEYTAPDGTPRTREGFFARVRVEPYGPGRIRPHERTHPGPREDRLRLTRATRANLSPIFSLFSDASGAAREALAPHMTDAPWDEVIDDDGTVHRLWRIGDPLAIAAIQGATREAELLIADGHHRYETARVYADEVGGEGPHRYVLACLVPLEDPGLLVFPTHRLVREVRGDLPETLATALKRDFEIEPLDSPDALVPAADGTVRFGYMDAYLKRPFMLTLKDEAIAGTALADAPAPYRRLNTAVLETLVLRGPLGMSEEAISHLDNLVYARSFEEARDLVLEGICDVGFFLAGTPVEQVREIAATGVNMPPKSTFFYPKLLTGLLFNPLVAD